MDVDDLRAEQAGLVSRRQALEAGLDIVAIKRRLRRRDRVAVHEGVYVGHTGPLSWVERAWAAVLCCWPAALTHTSALRAAEGPGRRDREESTIHVAVDRSRRVAAPAGVVVHRLHRFEPRVAWNLGPPRMRYDDAVLDCAGDAASDRDAIAVLADACGDRRTTAGRLAVALDARSRHPRRALVAAVLEDIETGVCSVLEHAYLTRVERPHGLPTGSRQVPGTTGGRRLFRDVLYVEQQQVVELDGRLGHSSTADRDRDLDRDLDAATEGTATVRLGYGQVVDRPCDTAARVGKLLMARGWAGRPRQCPDCGGSGQPG